MKTKHLFEQHDEMIKNNAATIRALKDDITAKKRKLDELNQKYKEFVNDGHDDKADNLFAEIVSTEMAIKMNEKKLNTKVPILNKKERDNAIAILKQIDELPKLYADEKAALEEKYETAKRQLMEVETEITGLNDTYDDDFLQYVGMFEDYDHGFPEDKTFRQEAEKQGVRSQDYRHHFQKLIIKTEELDKKIKGVR